MTSIKVIVVEDTFDDGQLISKILTFAGIEVVIAKNGDECLNLLTQFEPNAIVTDLAMPTKDGWQTLVAVRSNPKTAHIPVIAVTSFDSTEVAENVHRAGFDGYFQKPINPQTFTRDLRAIAAF